MPDEPNSSPARPRWDVFAKRIIKSELKLRGMTYADLVQALAEQGVRETERNLRNKVSRGRFTAVFFFQCLGALGVSEIKLPKTDIPDNQAPF